MEHYVAHLLFLLSAPDDEDDIGVWEQAREIVVLVEAGTYKRAWREAEKIGKKRTGEIVEHPQSEHECTLSFVGIRELSLIAAPKHGSELTSIRLAFPEKDQVHRFVAGESLEGVVIDG